MCHTGIALPPKQLISGVSPKKDSRSTFHLNSLKLRLSLLNSQFPNKHLQHNTIQRVINEM